MAIGPTRQSVCFIAASRGENLGTLRDAVAQRGQEL